MAYLPDLSFAPTALQDEYQSQALKELLQYLNQRSPYYSRLFQQQQIDISIISGIEDLNQLPTTSKEDMQAANWDFLCIPRGEVKEYTATSGTMGKPVTIALSQNDLDRLAYNEHQSFKTAGGHSSDIYQLMLTLDRQFMAGIAYYQGIRSLGASLVRTGPGLPNMQWDTINKLQCNKLVSVPSFLLKMIEYAQDTGIDLKANSVEGAICIGENIRTPNFELNALGKNIKDVWNVTLYSTYASTEMQTAFTECSAGRGGHHQPDLIILEITDDAGNALPEGVPGEVTITTLGVEGMPLLRYRTGDICAYYNEPCSCGRTTKRLSPVLGRKQQMIKYKGTTLYPPAVFDILNQLPYIKEYIVEVYIGMLGTDELKLHLHTTLPIDDCEHKIKPVLQSKLRVVPSLHFHSASEMQAMQFPAGSRKQVKFIDNRHTA